MTQPADLLIPRVFHQIWLGPDPLPEECEAYRRSWPEHNPGWELRLWREDDIPADARRPEVFETLRSPAERSDILRFEILWRVGGIYIDMDFECLRPIERLLGGARFVAGYRKPGRVNNALVGSVPGHPVADRALTDIRPRTTYGPVDKSGTGPVFLDRVLAHFGDEVTILDQPILYPRTQRQLEQAHAVHHRARTWKDADGLRRSVRKTQRRLLRATEHARQYRAKAEAAEAELARLRAKVEISS
jgi:inositol phosphorylceramide mannosyltransferase catalytic subunit